MRAPLRLPLGLLFVLALPALAPAQAEPITIAVIVARDDPHRVMDKVLLGRIYRRQMRLLKGGAHISPVNLPVGHALRRAFSQALFGKSPDAMAAFWNRLYFRGISPPYVLQSQEAVLRFVAGTPGAIGYIATCRLDARVRSVMRVVLPSPAPAQLRTQLCH